jgi:hypothetical protein
MAAAKKIANKEKKEDVEVPFYPVSFLTLQKRVGFLPYIEMQYIRPESPRPRPRRTFLSSFIPHITKTRGTSTPVQNTW